MYLVSAVVCHSEVRGKLHLQRKPQHDSQHSGVRVTRMHSRTLQVWSAAFAT